MVTAPLGPHHDAAAAPHQGHRWVQLHGSSLLVSETSGPFASGGIRMIQVRGLHGTWMR